MFDKAMSAAVETAQKRLMNTTGKDSVLMAVSSDLNDLCGLTEKLDPSKINFDKGGLEKLKVMNYWSRFEKNYPALQALSERLIRSKKILFNSRTTINKFLSEYSEEYNKFRAVPESRQDADYVQQAVISENMYQLLKNSVSEHESAYVHLEKVITILESSLNMAIYLAKKNAGYELGGGRALPLNVTNLDYQTQFGKLDSILHTKTY